MFSGLFDLKSSDHPRTFVGNTVVIVYSRRFERMIVLVTRSNETLSHAISRSAFGFEAAARKVRSAVRNLIPVGGNGVIDIARVRPRHGLSGFDCRYLRIESEVISHRDGLIGRGLSVQTAGGTDCR